MSPGAARILLASFVLFILAAVGLIYCGHARDEKVRRAFADANPDVEVLHATVGEGDFDNAWYHIGYRKDGGAKEAIVLYQLDGFSWETNRTLKLP